MKLAWVMLFLVSKFSADIVDSMTDGRLKIIRKVVFGDADYGQSQLKNVTNIE